MTHLIKSSDKTGSGLVRAFAGAKQGALVPFAAADTEVAALRRRIEALNGELQTRDLQIQQQQAEIKQAFKDGETAGRDIGLKEADQAVEKRLSMLAAAIEQALTLFSKEMADLEHLAPLLAREGIDLILGDSGRYADLIQSTLGHHLHNIDATTLIRVEVSRSDFSDPNSLADRLGRPGIEIVATDQLAPGDCRIKLTLGSLEIGVDQQRLRIAEALESLADPPAVA